MRVDEITSLENIYTMKKKTLLYHVIIIIILYKFCVFFMLYKS